MGRTRSETSDLKSSASLLARFGEMTSALLATSQLHTQQTHDVNYSLVGCYSPQCVQDDQLLL